MHHISHVKSAEQPLTHSAGSTATLVRASMRPGTARSDSCFTLDDKRRSCTKSNKKFGYQHQLQQAPQGFFREATTGTPAMPTTRLRQPRPVTASVNGVVNGWCVRVPPTQVCALSHASWCRSLPCNELRLSCWSGQAQCSCRHVV